MLGDWIKIKGAAGSYKANYDHYQIQNAAQEVGPNEITKLSDTAGTPPAAITVSADDLMNKSKHAKYRGSLVKIENVKIKTAPDSFGTFVLENDLYVSAYLNNKDDYSTYAVGTEFTSITGMFDVYYDVPIVHPKTIENLVKK